MVFPQEAAAPGHGVNFPAAGEVAKIEGPWEVSFDPKWGGPEKVGLHDSDDWTRRPEEGIRYYCGTAVYRKQFHVPSGGDLRVGCILDLGTVKNVARVNSTAGALAWSGPPLGMWRSRGPFVPASMIWRSRWPTSGPTV